MIMIMTPMMIKSAVVILVMVIPEILIIMTMNVIVTMVRIIWQTLMMILMTAVVCMMMLVKMVSRISSDLCYKDTEVRYNIHTSAMNTRRHFVCCRESWPNSPQNTSTDGSRFNRQANTVIMMILFFFFSFAGNRAWPGGKKKG